MLILKILFSKIFLGEFFLSIRQIYIFRVGINLESFDSHCDLHTIFQQASQNAPLRKVDCVQLKSLKLKFGINGSEY